MTIRIAMWSGPRNISTAMMRSWENRQDCSVVDEPFYAYYLNQTQSPHPMFDEVIASQPTDYELVAKNMSEGSCGTPLQYQKHMTQHMLTTNEHKDDFEWAKDLRHCFLIRDPAQVVNSYTNSRGECSPEDIGIKRQHELFVLFSQMTGQNIPVIDSNDVLAAPQDKMHKLCKALALPFDENMMSWPTGRRASDGVWAEHWYHSVEKSTGFGKSLSKSFTLNSQQQKVVDEVMPFYEALQAHAL
ncbi:HAD family hydrolase [Glaciecola sp. MH2013]|uniref:sulfotransferase-like domain-containing protein n=1 Tax=Glaciecola sp. MH2013 TaxID=2785524 RepID=UPI00189CE248|nr:HAD family hydrolase [Glaciecola sp. MH2013]MBF7072107.1 HAD family hydrolase [Glaciecola sp. MH2013]